MRMREAELAGIPARIFRVSFSGELSYEINVPADFGLALWERLMAAGEPHGIAPYGTEAMHVLRAEKGYPMIGQETDGSVTPLDLGFGAMIAEKDFLGRRSLMRSDTARPDRKQLVGLLPDDPAEILPEGAQLVAEPDGTPPLPMIGHVTSSYYGRADRARLRAGAGRGRTRASRRAGLGEAARPHRRGADLPAGVLRSRRAAARWLTGLPFPRRSRAGGTGHPGCVARGGRGLRCDVAALAGPGVVIYRDELAGLGIDEPLACRDPVRPRRPVRKRLVAPALDRHTDNDQQRPAADPASDHAQPR